MRLNSGLAAAVLVLFGLNTAQANIVPTFSLAGTNPVDNLNGTYTYRYDVQIDAVQAAQDGDFFTLFDIDGFVSATAIPGWTLSTPSVGPAPQDPFPFVLGITDTAVTNVSYERTGGTLNGPQVFSFDVISTIGLVGLTQYGAEAHLRTGGPFDNAGTTLGPRAIPEPSVMVMLGVVGLFGLGCRTIRRKRAAA